MDRSGQRAERKRGWAELPVVQWSQGLELGLTGAASFCYGCGYLNRDGPSLCYILLNVRCQEYCRSGESLGGPMARPAKPTGRSALCGLPYLLCATGIGIGLTGCVVPGMSTFVMKPERIVPPPSQKIAQPAASDGSEQNSKGEPRRELVFPKMSDLPSPRVKK